MKINQKFYYVINYKPLLNYKKELLNTSGVYCKNFFLFFLLFNFLKQKNQFDNLKIKIQKKKYYYNSFLRAPNKYKKAQVKINLIRYRVVFNFTTFYVININNFSNNINIENLNYLMQYFLNYFFFFLSHHFFFLKENN